jgi:hypothetical protein
MWLDPAIQKILEIVKSALNPNGGWDTNIQDQTTPSLDLFFLRPVGAPTTLTQSAVLNEYTLELTDATDFVTGTYVGVFSDVGRYYFGEVLIKSVNQITLDTPLDFAFDSAVTKVLPTSRDMNVDGSETPVTFSIQAGESGLVIDLTRLIVSMTHGSAGDDGLYGNLTKLTRGLVLRRVDGNTRNYWNIKDNGEWANLSYDVTYSIRSGGGGTFGTRSRYSWAGTDKHGVAVRLGPGERLDAIVQDDLTGLTSKRMLVAGHETDEGITSP